METGVLNGAVSRLRILVICLMTADVVHSDEAVDYLRQVKPLLQERCFACHGALKQESGLRLDTSALAIQGGESGPAIVPGEASASRIISRISSADPADRMPPEGEPLKGEQIRLIERWISQGAMGPADEEPEQDPRAHWAFQKPVRQAVPAVSDPDWGTASIDAFLAAGHERHDLKHQSTADPLTLLRRISLDLTGLPPTLAEQDDFLQRTSKEGLEPAYKDVVDRLLASPQYGERWGRHWMDIWRYSDWWGLGAEVRNSQKHIWHWRDWIIESLNEDKGYDQMLREMLAADELYPNDLSRLRATGFLARQYFKFNRTSWLDETIEHTSKAMLGLTFNCCKCHDHKYDPFEQTDYYRLRAVFEPYQIRIDQVVGETDLEKDGIPRAFDCNLDVSTFVHIRGDDRNPDSSNPLLPGIPSVLSFDEWKVVPVSLPAEAIHPGLRGHVVQNYLGAAQKKLAIAQQELEQAKADLVRIESEGDAGAARTVDGGAPKEGQSKTPEEASLAQIAAEKRVALSKAELESIQHRAAAERARVDAPETEQTLLLVKQAAQSERAADVAKAEGDLAQAELALLRKAGTDKLPEISKQKQAAEQRLQQARKALDSPGETFTPLAGAIKTLESNLETEESRMRPFPPSSTGRRTAFASWITDERNPLTARVAVNHIWMRHMGRALVPTVFDFGRKGTPPTHPELLDWLAVELMESGWSMKHVHRLVVMSQAYRMSSSAAGFDQNAGADVGNRFYWRANPSRMESQVVRDSLLLLAGQLDLTAGGPSIPVKDEKSRRRSLYFVHSHNEHQKFLAMFDDASVLDCYRRAESIVPQQALALENSELASTMAAKIAENLAQGNLAETDEQFCRLAFRLLLCTEPNEEELQLALKSLQKLTEAATTAKREQPDRFARQLLVLALINHNDFVTIR